jgi:hypothetical protein
MPYPKFIAYAPGGGKGSMRLLDQTISSGANDLGEQEFSDWNRARLMAAPANGGTLDTAKTFLEARGWDVLWETPPAQTNNDTYTIRIPADLKDWAQANGGPALVRRLLEGERARQDREARAEAEETAEWAAELARLQTEQP